MEYTAKVAVTSAVTLSTAADGMTIDGNKIFLGDFVLLLGNGGLFQLTGYTGNVTLRQIGSVDASTRVQVLLGTNKGKTYEFDPATGAFTEPSGGDTASANYPNVHWVTSDPASFDNTAALAAQLSGCSAVAAGEKILCQDDSGGNVGIWIVTAADNAIPDPTFTVIEGATVTAIRSPGSPTYRQTAATGSGTAVFRSVAYDSTDTDVWFGPPIGNAYPDVRFVAVSPGTINPAACTFADFLNANNSAYGTYGAFTAGKKVLIQSGANRGVWTIDAGATSLTRDAAFSTVQGQMIHCVESATVGAAYEDVPVYEQTADTGAVTPVFALQGSVPAHDSQPFEDLIAAEIVHYLATGVLRKIHFIPSSKPYIFGRWTHIDPGNGAYKWRIFLEGSRVIGVMAPAANVPRPTMFAIDYSLSGHDTTVAVAAKKGTFTLTVAAAPVDDFICVGVSPTSWMQVHGIEKITANGGNFDLLLDSELVQDYPISVPVAGVSQHGEDILIDAMSGDSSLSGTCARVFSAAYCRHSRFRANIDDVDGPSYMCASFDLAGSHNTHEIKAAYHDGAAHLVAWESNYQSAVRDSDLSGGAGVLDDGGVENGVYTTSVRGIAANNCIGTLNSQAPSCIGLKVHDCLIVGGENGAIAGNSGAGTSIKDMSIQGTQFRGQTGVAINSGVSGLQIGKGTSIEMLSGADSMGFSQTGGSATVTGLSVRSSKPGTPAGVSNGSRGVNAASSASVVLDGYDCIDVPCAIYAASGAVVKCSTSQWDCTSCTSGLIANQAGIICIGASVTLNGVAAKFPATNYANISVQTGGTCSVSNYKTTGGSVDIGIQSSAQTGRIGAGCELGATAVSDITGVTIQQTGGVAAKAITTANVTLTFADMYATAYELTGALTGDRSLIHKFVAPGHTATYNNATTGAQTVTIKASASDTGIVLTQGKRRTFSVTAAGAIVALGAEV